MADFSDFTAEQTAADDAQYRAMADELSQPDPDIPEAFGDAIEPGDIPSSREPGPQPAEQQQGGEISDEEWEAQTAAELDELWAMRAEQLQHQVPALEEDPIGHFQAKLGQIEAAHQQQQQAEFWNTVIQSENEARQELPDYDKATTFLEESRVAELKALYPDRNPHALAMARQNGFQSIQQFRDYILNQDRVTVAATALQRGVPGQVLLRACPTAGMAGTWRLAIKPRLAWQLAGQHARRWDGRCQAGRPGCG